MASFTIGVLSLRSHGGTKENNGKLSLVPLAIFDPGTFRNSRVRAGTYLPGP